jgi:hypothetical protein
VREQLGRLIREAIRNPGRFGKWLQRTRPKIAERVPRYRQERRRLVLIIDDLERCRPPRAIDVCEVASQLLGHQDVVTIIIADMATLAASAEIRYAALETVPNRQGDPADGQVAIQPKGAYGRLYLEKMVQIQFDLPPPSSTDLRNMLTGFVGAEDVPAERPTAKLSLFDAVLILASVVGRGGVLAALVVLGVVAALVGILVGPIAAIVASAAAVVVLLTTAVVAILWLRRPRPIEQAQELSKGIRGEVSSGVAGALAVIAAGALGAAAGPFVAPVATLAVDTLVQFLAQTRGDRKERFITDESPERKQGEAAILKFLADDDVPRRAKRMVNHLRLLLLVADKRKMFGGSQPLEASHLGKWIVLLERWPELGRALRADPSVMALIEEAADTEPGALQEVLHRIVPEVASSPDLAAFLKDETKLAGLVERLIYYRPRPMSNKAGSLT